MTAIKTIMYFLPQKSLPHLYFIEENVSTKIVIQIKACFTFKVLIAFDSSCAVKKSLHDSIQILRSILDILVHVFCEVSARIPKKECIINAHGLGKHQREYLLHEKT